jgi:uncharacterized protein
MAGVAPRSPASGVLLAVVDTNVLISAALSPNGAPAQVVDALLRDGQLVFLNATFAELETRIWKPKFDRYLNMEQRASLLHDFNAAAHWVEIPDELSAITYCRDADDDKFIQTALAAQAPLLITGDADLLEVPAMPGLQIVSPAQALALPELAALQEEVPKS